MEKGKIKNLKRKKRFLTQSKKISSPICGFISLRFISFYFIFFLSLYFFLYFSFIFSLFLQCGYGSGVPFTQPIAKRRTVQASSRSPGPGRTRITVVISFGSCGIKEGSKSVFSLFFFFSFDCSVLFFFLFPLDFYFFKTRLT